MNQKEIIRDLWTIGGMALLLIAAGLGWRDPWPADEPRFALIARDMVATGQWLFPQVGGDPYPDKPPLFMWLIAAFYWLTGSLRLSFLLPSLLAGLGTLALVYDLGRRLWDREAGRWAALALLFAVQFTLQAKRAQIDMVLVSLTTLSLYAFLRYLLLGHGVRWWALGGFAAGLGVITKGVGFLPFLVLLPYAYARRKQWTLPHVGTGWTWAIAPAAFFVAIGLWLVPMLIAVAGSGDPSLIAYRDEILLHQTAQRYTAAWHHHQPFYYYFTVIVSLWIPLAILIPWLAPRWKERILAHDARVLLPLAWIVLVLVFFSASPGKRGVYIFPALPALALLSGEWLKNLAQQRGVQRAGAIFSTFVVLVCAAVFVFLTWIKPERTAELIEKAGANILPPLAVISILGAIVLAVFKARRGLLATAWVMSIVWLVFSVVISPRINGGRSASGFVAKLEAAADPARELGLVGYKEQFLLYLKRPIVNFGHARWREGPAETYDAARWLNEAPNRQLMVNENQLNPCFAPASQATEVGSSSGDRWFLVSAPASVECARQGSADKVFQYRPR